MARSFDGANDNINFGNVVPINTSNTLSFSGWSYVNNVTQDHLLVGNALTGGFELYNDDVGSATGRTDTFKVFVMESAGAGGTAAQIEGATNASVANTWQHLAFVMEAASADGLQLWVNGVQDANSPVSTASLADLGSTTQDLRYGETNGGTRDRNGLIAECGFWNRRLVQAEIQALAKGFSPLFFKRGLISYMPLFGNISPEPDLKVGGTGTVTGAVKADHPRIIYPKS